MRVDQDFFRTLLKLAAASTWVEWRFEPWLTSIEYRRAWLQSMGLTVDIRPPVTREGGGSSFTRTGPLSADSLQDRFRHVSVPPDVLTLLALPEHAHLLSVAERATVGTLCGDN